LWNRRYDVEIIHGRDGHKGTKPDVGKGFRVEKKQECE
jgi:hypothetical protein